MLNEVKSEKDKYYIIYSLICGILKKTQKRRSNFWLPRWKREGGGIEGRWSKVQTNSCREILVNMMYVTYNTVL